MTHTLTVSIGDRDKSIEIIPEKSLYEILAAEPEVELDAPCGGKAKCGKCKVTIVQGQVSEITDTEKELLSAAELQRRVRLACRTYPQGDVEIRLRETSEAHIAASGIEYSVEVLPNVQKTPLSLAEPSLSDQRDDFSRLSESLDGVSRMSVEELRRLPGVLKESKYSVTAVHDRESVLTVEPGDTAGSNFGIAVDIGTTTVVVYLVNLSTGDITGTTSALNSQKPYGQDVISRISYTIDNQSGTAELQQRIIGQMNSMIEKVTAAHAVSKEHIYSMVLAGNTTMMHLAAGLPTRNLAAAPFIPVVKRGMTYHNRDFGFHINGNANIYLVPSISAYVGADIVADIISSELYKSEETALLIDVGTNGEIVLGNRDGILCCSTAAGPAFEGATIRHGMGGISGAINTVGLNDGSISFTTIADAPAAGICGSGIVDAMALLLDCGAVDASGKMIGEEEAEATGVCKLAGKLTVHDERPAIILADGSEAETGEPILLIQKDVREVQLAKAAIAAGVATLLAKTGRTVDDIDIVYLAGGFGSYIDRRSASRIGLIPRELENKIRVIGNGAGTGAVLSLISSQRLADCERIANMAEYVELSASPEFQDAYFENMMFPEQ